MKLNEHSDATTSIINQINRITKSSNIVLTKNMTFETEPLLCTSLNMIVEGNLRKQMLCNSEFTFCYLRNSYIKQSQIFC